MPCEIRIESDRGIVLVRCWGEYVTLEHEAIRRESFQTCRTHGIRRILVDLLEVETSSTVSTMELYDFGASFQKDGFPGGIVFGILPPRGATSRGDMKFVTTVASNRGIPLKLFNDFDQAATWLCEQV